MSVGGVQDVVIVGGGVMGASVAWHLSLLSGGGLSILVVERDPTYARASSALSLGSIRQQFSTPLNIAMSRHGVGFVRSAAKTLSTAEHEVDLGFVERGYLFLADEDGEGEMRRSHEVQQQCGAPTMLIDRQSLRELYPWLVQDDLACASLGLRDEGWFDGYSLAQAFRRKAIEAGVRFVRDEAIGFLASDGRLHGVRLAGGGPVAARHVVNAAGPAAARLAALAGLDLPVRPQKRCVFVVDCPAARPDWPLVIDPSGIYFRPEGSGFLVGAPAPEGYADDGSLDVDHAVFEEVVWPRLAARAPAFETLKLRSAWAGHYEMNTVDHNAIIGRAPGLANFWLINGFSGHGMQQSPAAGRGLAELILFGGFQTLDLSPLGMERLLVGEAPPPERRVI